MGFVRLSSSRRSTKEEIRNYECGSPFVALLHHRAALPQTIITATAGNSVLLKNYPRLSADSHLQ